MFKTMTTGMMDQQQQQAQYGPPPTVEHLAALLSALTQPDTNTIRQAELALKPLLKNPATMMVMWQILQDATCQPVPVRHVTAVLLRKRLPAHYSTSYDEALRREWQQNVFSALACEPLRPIRAGLTGVAAALAAVEQRATEYMLQFLTAAANEQQNPAARELCFLLLSEMTETVGMHWKEHLPALLQLFSSTLHNAQEQAAVHKAAVQAVGQLMSFWADEPEIDGLAPLLPVLLQVAHVSSGHDEDFLATVLDVLYDLAYSPAPVLQQFLQVTTEFALSCLQNAELELRVRDAAALVIATTAEAKPKTFGRNEALLGRVLDTLFQLMQDSPASAAGALFESNPAWRQDLIDSAAGHGGGEADDFLDQDNPTETSMAQGTLDMIACEVPNKYVWPAVYVRCMERMNNPNVATARKAGVAGLGVVAEGCAEPLTVQLATILPAVFAAAQDPVDAQVRECACFCLGQISEHCQPDILQYATQILPIVFGLLDDNNVAVQATSCYVLEMFCERLEPQAVRPLLDRLVRKLASMLEATTKRSVQEMAVAALAATAVAAEEEFAPYVQGVASLMLKLMVLQDVHLFALRGRALECMGHMAIAVGRDTFRPYFADTMRCAMEGLTTESTDLQEFAYAVFANLAKVMKEEFAPALPELVPHLIKVIDMDEGQLQPAGADSDDEAGGGGRDPSNPNLGTLDDSDDEEGGDGNNYVLHVRTALFEVKKGAITALGEMAAHTGTSFCPHLEASMQVLQKAATNWHPLIKSEVADAFPSMILPSVQAYHDGQVVWKKGDTDGSATSQLSQHTSSIVQAVLTEELLLMKDEDKTTVGKACEAVQSVIEICGPHALAPVVNDALANTHDLLSKNAPCQQADELYGELPDDDDDHDVFMQAACDLVGAFGRVMGDHFAPYLPQFLPAIMQFAKPSRPASDRSMAVGCLSEIAQELSGPCWQEHWKTCFLPGILQGLQDEDENVNRNAAFLAGIACEQLKELAGPDFAAILQSLGPILAKAPQAQQAIATQQGVPSEAVLACMDNSAAAVARMIMASPNHIPSMEQVVPVFVRGLPLMVDMTENETVYNCLFALLNMKHPALEADQVQRVLSLAAAPESKVDDELKGRLAQALQSLSSQ